MPYILPDPGLRPLVMVPQEHINWMCDQSDSVLSARKPQVTFSFIFFFHFFSNHSHQPLSRRISDLVCSDVPDNLSRYIKILVPLEDMLTLDLAIGW